MPASEATAPQPLTAHGADKQGSELHALHQADLIGRIRKHPC